MKKLTKKVRPVFSLRVAFLRFQNSKKLSKKSTFRFSFSLQKMVQSRFPSRAASRSRSVSKSPTSGLAKSGHAFRESFRNKFLWLCVLLAVLIAVITIWMAREDYDSVHRYAKVDPWLANPILMSIVLVIVLLLAAVATAWSFHYTRANLWLLGIPAMFLVFGILWLAAVYETYRDHNFQAAFYISVAAFAVLLLHVLGMCYAASGMAVLMMVPLLVVAFVAMYVLWFMNDDSSRRVEHIVPAYTV